ncbi:hypothetical protein A2641_02920 [Candidatus Nomurabacteria bacterium RIFCSPHIGHO2_01_FULL_37_25]|uniref:DUF8128 domain-containing protein n=1 Tax=Candidatus Nomurabacteria bacterium RIFCSPLOWO2_01_FULL_36_16 TaxID=1801767 RepID=A0A1F6X0F2_9BACT|nr:MAG: hypothetical protein A2641_02920 [Candidatus Nomurabacteria bacterium RIFCSPHIGHO2_01_FULL_37_25]OGI75100.1 MAG: hypothetical protein A3D36_03665 [Candidatus Nomurabacteria bacterium RIFCSPHIGHO2_02_FULL_36_29]OGI87611.1 MAG: hypothetical protein A3A91_01740 [Candidatus Nomurabacteria bacterium RIFCSPLOWO2_01_FULL_36_16]OGI97270.1 MAG: hypothetical protein A3I84_01455 [Candidatus Nomurabacteria bacterium RIFCSPLOWO2_02_FULL_36_8]
MSDFFEAVENMLIEHWLKIVVLILIYFAWKLNLEKEILAFLGVVLLGKLAWIWWLHYIQQDFISGIDFVLLEIIPPREVLRSPKAMEFFITNALFHHSFKGGKEEFWQGAVWFWFSLEIASIDGQVHFYIRTPTRIRGLIETQMYAQYPQSQIKEVEDYTLGVPEITPEGEWNGWGCEFALLKPDAFPIKTYVDFGLDEDPKEEYKIDPISPLIELFGALEKGEQAWMQIVVTPADKTKIWRTKGTWFGKHGWVEESVLRILKIQAPYAARRDVKEDGSGGRIEIRTPDHLKNAVKKINEKTNKLGFETGIRVMYVAKKDIYPVGTRTNTSRNIRLIFRQYTNPDLNGLNRINSTQADIYGSIFMASKKTVMILANRMLHEYRERAFFHLPLRHHIFAKPYWNWPIPNILTLDGVIVAYAHPHTFVLNTEELASLWHFPGQILKVPTLERIESKEASPPTNLPI